jgi:Holliday junction resolvase RusA-like endonuclease
MEFELTIYAEPVAQGRPRFARVGKFVKAYDPKESVNWKAMVNAEAQRQVRESGFEMFPIGAALVASFMFVFPRPASVSVKKRPNHTVKPDLDNLIKGVKDALRGVVYHDDAQIVEYGGVTGKQYATDGNRPFVAIRIWERTP